MKTNNHIRELRERKRLTQKALAAELDISIATLNRIENGIIQQFKPEFLVRLSQVLNCPIDHFFKEIMDQETLPLSKELLYQDLIATKEKRIQDLEEKVKTKL